MILFCIENREVLTTKFKKMNTNIGISDINRQAVVNELSKILANEFVLYTKTRNAHWNVEGIDFYDKHKYLLKIVCTHSILHYFNKYTEICIKIILL